jgi:kynurenine formamidase
MTADSRKYDQDSRSWQMTLDGAGIKWDRAYDLAHPLHVGMARHPNHPAFTFSLIRRHGDVLIGGGTTVAAETFSMGGHTGTHMDGLGHVAVRGRVHGDQDIMANQSYCEGLSVNSVHEHPPFMGPAHLVNLPQLLGRDLTTSDEVGPAELEAWFKGKPAPTAGSAVLIRTGWAKYQSDYVRYVGVRDGLPGVVLSAAKWLTDRGVRLVGSDTVAFEKMPTTDLPVHVHLLVKSGVPIMESLSLDAVAKDGHYEFFLIVIPMPIRGGTASPVRPIALVSTR